MKWTDKHGIERCNCDESHKRIAQLEARCRDYEVMLRQIAKGDYEYVSTATALAEATLSAYAAEADSPQTTFRPLEDGLCLHCGRDARNHDFGGPCRPGSAMADKLNKEMKHGD